MDHQSLISGIIPILLPTPREGFALTSPMIGSGILEKVRSEVEIKWKIFNVFTKDKNCKCFVSPSFPFLEAEWRLLLFGEFPTKSTSDDPADNPSLVLLRNEDYCTPVEYTFEWIKLDGSVEQLLKGVMRSDQKRGDYCCIKLSEALHQNVDFEPTDITITFSVKLETIEKSPSKRKNLKRLETLSTNFTDLFFNQQCCDTTLRVKNREYKAHKAVLVARSSVFAGMFRSEVLQNQSAVVTLADCDPDSFEKFLEYLYCGKIEAVSPSSATALYEIAVKYDVQELMMFCSEYLIENLKNETLCDIVILADKFNDEHLMSAAQSFFKENFQDVCRTNEWKCLLENSNHLAKELLRSKVKDAK